MSTEVLVAVVGVGGVVIGGLLSSWLTRQQEHGRWLMDKRLDAYVAFNEGLTAWRDRKDYESLSALEHAGRRLVLVAPQDTALRAYELLEVIRRAATRDGPDDDDVQGGLIARLTVQQIGDLQPITWFRRGQHARALKQLDKKIEGDQLTQG